MYFWHVVRSYVAGIYPSILTTKSKIAERRRGGVKSRNVLRGKPLYYAVPYRILPYPRLPTLASFEKPRYRGSTATVAACVAGGNASRGGLATRSKANQVK